MYICDILSLHYTHLKLPNSPFHVLKLGSRTRQASTVICLSHQHVHAFYKPATAGNVSSGMLPLQSHERCSVGLEKIWEKGRQKGREEEREGERTGGRERKRDGGKAGGWENGRVGDVCKPMRRTSNTAQQKSQVNLLLSSICGHYIMYSAVPKIWFTKKAMDMVTCSWL